MKFDKYSLTSNEMRALHGLFDLQKKGIVENHSIRFISEFIKISSPTIEKALNGLEEKGFIKIKRVKPSFSKEERNAYTIICPLELFNCKNILRNSKREFNEDKFEIYSDWFNNG